MIILWQQGPAWCSLLSSPCVVFHVGNFSSFPIITIQSSITDLFRIDNVKAFKVKKKQQVKTYKGKNAPETSFKLVLNKLVRFNFLKEPLYTRNLNLVSGKLCTLIVLSPCIVFNVSVWTAAHAHCLPTVLLQHVYFFIIFESEMERPYIWNDQLNI